MYEDTWQDEGWMDPKNDVRPISSAASINAGVKHDSEHSKPMVGVDPFKPKEEPVGKRHNWNGNKGMWNQRRVAVFDEQGTLVGTEMGYTSDDTYNFLRDYFGSCQLPESMGVGTDWMVAVDLNFYVEKTVYTNRNFKPGPCLFDSTASLLQAIHGKQLHFSDRDYFDNHPLLEPHGTPTPYTARVVQEIVEPYGLRVCRIRLRKGFTPTGDLRDWMTYLGCNPVAAENLHFTNAQFGEMTGQTTDAVDRQFAFDFDDEPLRPSVICEAAMVNHFIAPVGHASYLAPRKKHGEWWLSLQFDASAWPNPARPIYEPYVLQEAFEVDFYGIRRAVEEYEKEKDRKEREADKGTKYEPTSVSLASAAAGKVQQ